MFHSMGDSFAFFTSKNRSLYFVSCMLFFWALNDGIVTYITPLIIAQRGFSETTLGIIIGSSSIAGAIFDFFLSRYLRNTHFRRVYFFMFMLSACMPLLLFKATTTIMFLIAMALWGFYYDLQNFGNFDFVGRKSAKEEHSSHFGVITLFKAIGYMLAPIITSLLIGSFIDTKPFIVMMMCLALAFTFYMYLYFVSKHHNYEYIKQKERRSKNIFREVSLWKRIGKIMFPVLTLTMLINIVDAFFWTIGPIIAEGFSEKGIFSGLFMTAHTLPPLITGWFVGSISNNLGKKKTAFLAFISACLLLSTLYLFNNQYLLVCVIFIASSCFALALPSLNGAYADYIQATSELESEIEGLEDFFTNIGYTVGPIAAGFLADSIGNLRAFSIMGFTCAIIACIAMVLTPRKIKIPANV